MMKIVLVGYMGSGKSVVGKLLSNKLHIPFFDLDNSIEEKVSKLINQIFSDHGEVYFRKIEHLVFQEIIDKKESFVLSLGGGTPCYANNHELLKSEKVISIYLKASIHTLTERLLSNRKGRPLLKNLSEDELEEYIAKHLFDRSFYYNQCKKTVNVDGKSLEEIVIEVQQLLL